MLIDHCRRPSMPNEIFCSSHADVHHRPVQVGKVGLASQLKLRLLKHNEAQATKVNTRGIDLAGFTINQRMCTTKLPKHDKQSFHASC